MDNGYFHAKVNPDKKPFTIVMPPPNVTGQLHMGHALDETMQDILIRFKRMQGYEEMCIRDRSSRDGAEGKPSLNRARVSRSRPETGRCV